MEVAKQVKMIDPLPDAFEVVAITVNGMNIAGDLTSGILIGELKKGESFDIVITVLVKEQPYPLKSPWTNEQIKMK